MTQEEVRQRILDYLPSFYNRDGNTVNYGISETFAEAIQIAYDTNSDASLAIFVDTATGEQLDDLALFFRLTRKPEETDAQLRARIKAYWPGFSGGGTNPSLKSTVNRITGVPEGDITITEINFLKFNVTIAVIGLSDIIETVKETVWQAKSAGTYPFFSVSDSESEGITISDWYDISSTAPSMGIIVGVYEIGGLEEI